MVLFVVKHKDIFTFTFALQSTA